MEKITYNLEQIYLELARSVVQSSFITLYRSSKEDRNLSYENNIRFAGVAVSIVFSYAAIEAFVNAQLHRVYNQIKSLDKEGKNAGLGYNFRRIKDKKHFTNDKSFENLLWIDLKEKLNVLASALDLALINDVDTNLWNKIWNITEEVRHFIIHPDPTAEGFNKSMNKIMLKHKAGEYVDIAIETLKYFYKGRKCDAEIPVWLNKNVIFRFLNNYDIEKTFDEIRNKLQTSRTVLEYLKEGKEISKDFIDRAIKDLDNIAK